MLDPLEKMETNETNLNSHQSRPLENTKAPTSEKPTERDVFVIHAEQAWHERRKQWIGDRSQKIQRPHLEPMMSLTTTYEDLLLSTEPFSQRIPLAEMVEFLVDIWDEEGLYD